MTRRIHKVITHRPPNGGITAMELVSNHSFPRHSHDEYGIGVVLSGAQRSWSGVGQVESLPSDVITVNPGELHDGHPINGRVRRWRIIYFEPAVLAHEFLPDAACEIEFISPSLRHSSLGNQVNILFDRLTTGADRLCVEEILFEVAGQLVARLDSPFESSRRFSPSITKALTRINDDPSSHISLLELASLSRISRYHFVRAFARQLGTTPHAYVVQRRVRLARQYLMAGETLAAAAQRAGFADQSHMTRAFVRQFGITPGRYLSGLG